MAINFPNSPSVNDIHSEGGIRWKWNGSSWTRASGAAVTDTITTANDNSTTTLYPVLTSGTGSQTAKIATTATKNISFDASDGNLTVGGNISAGGTITYEDVRNVDSLGIGTFVGGIRTKHSSSGKYASIHSNAAGAAVVSSDPDNNANNSSVQFHVDGTEAGRFETDRDFTVGNPNAAIGYGATISSVGNITAGIITARGNILVPSGKIGIGTDDAGRALTLRNAEPRIRLIDDDTGSFSEVYTDNSGHLYLSADAGQSNGGSRILFNVDGSEKGRINNSGQVGISTSANFGDAKLTVEGVTTLANTDQTIMVRDSNADDAVGRGGNIGFGAYVNGTMRTLGGIGALKKNAGNSFNGDLALYTRENGEGNLSERLRINSTGKVGIGTNNPSTWVHLQTVSTTGDEDLIRFSRSQYEVGKIRRSAGTMRVSGDGNLFLEADYNADHGATDSNIVFNIDNDEKVRIRSNGRVGIGTEDPAEVLHVLQSGTTAAEFRLENNEGYLLLRADSNVATYGAQQHIFHNRANNSEYLRIDSSGRLLVGRTSASNSDSKMEIQGSTDTYLRIASGNTGGSAGVIFGSSDDHSTGGIYYVNSDDSLQFAGYDNTTRLTITSDGDVNASTGHLQSQDLKLGLAADRYPIIQRAVQSSGSQSLSITGGSGYSEHTGSDHSLVDAREGALIQLGGGDPTSDTYGGYIKYFAHGHTSPNNPGSGNQHVFYTRSGVDTNTERLRITAAGAVQLNADTGSSYFSVGASQDFKWYHDAGGPTIFSDTGNQGLKLSIKELNLTEYTGVTTRLKIDSSGRVLIGTTTEGHANGDDLTIATSGDTGMTIRSGTTHNGRIYFSDATSGTGEYAGALDYDHNDNKFSIFTNSAEILRIAANQGSSGTTNVLKLYNDTNTDASATCEIQANHDIRDSSKIVFGRENANDWSASWASQHSFLSFHTFNGSSNLTEKMRITGAGKFGFGTTTPYLNKVCIKSDVSAATHNWALHLLNGTHAGDSRVGLAFQANNNAASNTWDGAGIYASNDGSTGACHTIFGTVINGSFTERMRIRSNGDMTFNNCTTTINSSNYGLYFLNDSNSTKSIFIRHSRECNGSHTTAEFYGNQGSMRIYGDGDVKNTNNSYGSLSDETLKQDIVDASSQWNDIKAIKVRKFRFKDNPTGGLQIGVVAQELETVSPKLVTDVATSSDDLTSTETVKAVKYSVLYMKAIKCLQEAQARIETLEAEVAALKSS